MNFVPPRIYPITDAPRSGLSHRAQAERLIAGGARLIQLRDKSLTSQDFYEDAVETIAYARQHAVRVIINDRVDIALYSRADGVHLGQDDLPPEEARRMLGSDAIIGYSTHSIEQAMTATRLPIDYIAIGPIFPTRSKQDPDAAVGLNGLKDVRKAVDNIPLVAIGGINPGNLRSVFDAGANSAAMISALLARPDIRSMNALSGVDCDPM
ncbi:MAG TPA: thiamine phosphate synthase [Pyrinomonadaceae bacterium]|nr:thiamine phosphate synthase [Pyrinomonadaceae bacterium]